MAGLIFILISTYIGFVLTKGLVCVRSEGQKKVNTIWILIPASFGVGTLTVTWAVYIVSWFLSCYMMKEKPLLGGNLIVLLIAGVISVLHFCLTYKRYGRKEGIRKRFQTICAARDMKKEAILFGGLFLFSILIFFYVFFVKDGLLYSGLTVFSDYAPHTAMMRSFSLGNNFPTQYPHFGGEDVKYHFMFQFLVGNLEFLGMRIDIAYNLMSALSLTGFLMLLYSLAKRLTGGFISGALTPLLFVFRSGTTFFQYVIEHIQAGDLWETLYNNSSFIGYTTNENWGFWNFNVYLNQRHLAFGLILGALAIWVFLDWLEAGSFPQDTIWVRMKKVMLSKEGWMIRKPDIALLVGLFLGLCSFWNGAVVIGTLLILAGFAVFSVGKLDYAIMAAVAIFFSVLQSKLFIWGNAVSPTIYFGFLADQRTISGVFIYLVMITGFFFVGIIPLLFLMKRYQRAVVYGFFMPLIFAFFVSLTPDIAVNHKYILISYAFVTIFWAGILELLFRKNWGTRIVAVILCVCLMTTGIYDFVIVLRNNGETRSLTVPMKNDITQWLSDHLRKDDLILTPEYSMNPVTMSGAMLYCGWPYYAWSAGYDTYYRASIARSIYTEGDRDVVRQLVEQEPITYILFEADMTYEDATCREDVISDLYPKVYTSENSRTRIYQVKKE